MLYRITWWKNTILAIFLQWQWQLRTRRPKHIGGTTAPCYICWWEQKLQGAKVPGSESSTPGTYAPGSEWSWERKVHNSVEFELSWVYTYNLITKIILTEHHDYFNFQCIIYWLYSCSKFLHSVSTLDNTATNTNAHLSPNFLTLPWSCWISLLTLSIHCSNLGNFISMWW